VTSSLDVFVAAIRVKSTHVIKSFLKTRKKRENVEINFLHKSPPKNRLDIEFTACKGELMPDESLTSLTVSDAYR